MTKSQNAKDLWDDVPVTNREEILKFLRLSERSGLKRSDVTDALLASLAQKLSCAHRLQ